jgi:hypothetical protein
LSALYAQELSGARASFDDTTNDKNKDALDFFMAVKEGLSMSATSSRQKPPHPEIATAPLVVCIPRVYNREAEKVDTVSVHRTNKRSHHAESKSSPFPRGEGFWAVNQSIFSSQGKTRCVIPLVRKGVAYF